MWVSFIGSLAVVLVFGIYLGMRWTRKRGWENLTSSNAVSTSPTNMDIFNYFIALIYNLSARW
jgi:hypothetical protein